ncbi:MAG TPA: hypothetical protein PK080_00440 [Hyphomonadaceae bacterium]|nr:hypothetical protein [Hyphomonadaceae bacterium]
MAFALLNPRSDDRAGMHGSTESWHMSGIGSGQVGAGRNGIFRQTSLDNLLILRNRGPIHSPDQRLKIPVSAVRFRPRPPFAFSDLRQFVISRNFGLRQKRVVELRCGIHLAVDEAWWLSLDEVKLRAIVNFTLRFV